MGKVQNVKKVTLWKVIEALGHHTAEELGDSHHYDKTMLPVSAFVDYTKKALERAYKNLEKAKNPVKKGEFYVINVDNYHGTVEFFSKSECDEVANNIQSNIKYIEKLLKRYEMVA